MLNILKLGAITAVALGTSLAAVTAMAAELRYAHVGAEGDIQTVYAAQAAEAIKAATNGDVTVTVYPASQLGGVAEMVDGVRMGSISMGHHDFASLARLVPEVAVFNAPFIYRDGAHALAATDPDTSPALQAVNEKLIAQGVRIIGRIYRGDRHISSNFPVKTPADLAGKPFRAVPLELWVSMVKGFGAIPTPVEVAELPTALMTGVVVGQENPLTMIASNNLNEVQSHLSMTGHMRAVLAVFINEEVWQGMSEEQRAAITKVLDDEAEKSLQMATQAEAKLVEDLKGRGMTVITEADGLDVATFREKVSAQIKQDFPNFEPLIAQIEAVE
ncbi:2,3-diketo-L-gulonate-binding periplasmic protein YiaO [Ensifer adhaerens]|uniref:TRAP transporter substrate-binding protein n=1 Tax=Ensifer adhaerens TaxID=106592 RepID=UPI0015680AD6|nr:TRAP transporter substrate-binding protein [Ensifer adhaerens]NRP21616.1 2,3-diketo-L-gulonate-binding periplasmic protein YiaO [Ensifer adhaerens]